MLVEVRSSRRRRRRSLLPFIPIAIGVIAGGLLSLAMIGLFPGATVQSLETAGAPAEETTSGGETEPAEAPTAATPTAPKLQAALTRGPAKALAKSATGAGRPDDASRKATVLAAAVQPPPVAELLEQDRPAAAAPPAPITQTIAIGRGDTLMKVMLKAGAERGQAHAAIAAMAKLHDPRRLKPGQEIKLTFAALTPAVGAGQARPRLLDVSLEADVDRLVIARRSAGGGFKAETVLEPLTEKQIAAAGRIDGSLFQAAEAAKIPAQIIIDLIRLYSFDIDFQRDIQPGDRFELLYDVFEDETARPFAMARCSTPNSASAARRCRSIASNCPTAMSAISTTKAKALRRR